jgi:hypothetical protein
LTLAAGLALGTFAGAPAAHATFITLADGNSSVDFDTQTQAGAANWNIDGQDVLKKQWFWYRVGNAAPEQSLDTVPQTFVLSSDTSGDAIPDFLRVVYTSAGQFSLDTRYGLTGGSAGSGTADLAETIRINNLTAAPLDFHFFQYVDLDLSASDAVVMNAGNPNTVDQLGLFATANETVVTPAPAHREANFFPLTLGKLNDAAPTTLSDVLLAGPGDTTWAFQWDFTIPANGTVIISKDKLVTIPEPATLSLFGMAAAGALALRRRRR